MWPVYCIFCEAGSILLLHAGCLAAILASIDMVALHLCVCPASFPALACFASAPFTVTPFRSYHTTHHPLHAFQQQHDLTEAA